MLIGAFGFLIIAMFAHYVYASNTFLLIILCSSLALFNIITELRNDHKDVTNKIDKNLEILHSSKLSRNEQTTSRGSGKSPNSLLSNESHRY